MTAAADGGAESPDTQPGLLSGCQWWDRMLRGPREGGPPRPARRPLHVAFVQGTPDGKSQPAHWRWQAGRTTSCVAKDEGRSPPLLRADAQVVVVILGMSVTSSTSAGASVESSMSLPPTTPTLNLAGSPSDPPHGRARDGRPVFQHLGHATPDEIDGPVAMAVTVMGEGRRERQGHHGRGRGEAVKSGRDHTGHRMGEGTERFSTSMPRVTDDFFVPTLVQLPQTLGSFVLTRPLVLSYSFKDTRRHHEHSRKDGDLTDSRRSHSHVSGTISNTRRGTAFYFSTRRSLRMTLRGRLKDREDRAGTSDGEGERAESGNDAKTFAEGYGDVKHSRGKGEGRIGRDDGNRFDRKLMRRPWNNERCDAPQTPSRPPPPPGPPPRPPPPPPPPPPRGEASALDARADHAADADACWGVRAGRTDQEGT